MMIQIFFENGAWGYDGCDGTIFVTKMNQTEDEMRTAITAEIGRVGRFDVFIQDPDEPGRLFELLASIEQEGFVIGFELTVQVNKSEIKALFPNHILYFYGAYGDDKD